MNATKTLSAIWRLVRLPLWPTVLADASVVTVLATGGLDWAALAGVWAAATGLYVFGMAGNDVFDVARDRKAMAESPGGRVNPIAAGQLSRSAGIAVTAFGALLAILAAAASPAVNGWATAAGLVLILAYNAGAKRFPPIGLVLLGAVRAANASQGLTGAEALHWWAVPAIIGMHVVFVSAFAYAWERKRPLLYGNNWFGLMVVFCGTLVAASAAFKLLGAELWPAGMEFWQVGAAWGAFGAAFVAIFVGVPRAKRGPVLVLAGLSWLIILDWSFTLAAGLPSVGYLYAGLLIGVVVLRHIGRLLAGRPQVSRASRPRRRSRARRS